MNCINIIGNFVKDIELKFSTGGTAIATGTVAVKRSFVKEGGQESDFLYVKCLGKRGENMAQYFGKGSEIAITGSYQRDTWKDNEGNWKEANYVFVDNWSFTQGSKKKDNQSQGTSENFNYRIDPSEFQAIEDTDDIPF